MKFQTIFIFRACVSGPLEGRHQGGIGGAGGLFEEMPVREEGEREQEEAGRAWVWLCRLDPYEWKEVQC